MTTDYAGIASKYDSRYANNRYPGSESAVLQFVGSPPCAVLELGCGTGHWLALLDAHGLDVTGIDPSAEMLARACTKLPAERLVTGCAEQLPSADESFDRVLIMNALHHFRDPSRALGEARRVLRPGGALMSVGLDPSTGEDNWSIYDHFEGTRERDLARFPATSELRLWLEQAGFEDCATSVAERIGLRVPAREALAAGRLAKHSTSQLSDLSDAAYARGIAAVEQAATAAEARGEVLQLVSHLQLFATIGQVRR